MLLALIQDNSIRNLAKAAASPQEVEAVKALLLSKVEELTKAIEELNSKHKTNTKKTDGPPADKQ
jgi:hypothetical protein